MKLNSLHKFFIAVAIYLALALGLFGLLRLTEPVLDESDLVYTEGVCVNFDHKYGYKHSDYYIIKLDDGRSFYAPDGDLTEGFNSLPDLSGKVVKIGYEETDWTESIDAIHIECEGIKYKTVESYNDYNAWALAVFEGMLIIVFLFIGGWELYSYLSLHYLREEQRLREGYESRFSIKYSKVFDLRQMESLLLSRKVDCRVGYCKRRKKKGGSVKYGILYVGEDFAIKLDGKRYADIWIKKELCEGAADRLLEFIRLTNGEISILHISYNESEIEFKDITPDILERIVYK